MDWEEGLIADMRAHDGRVTFGPLAGDPLLIMTSTGAQSGLPRRAILSYSRDGDAYVVAGTAGGSPTDPRWVANVAKTPEVQIEVENRTFDATAEVVDGTGRRRLWDAHVVVLPRFAAYPAQTGRDIPMIRIVPREAAATG